MNNFQWFVIGWVAAMIFAMVTHYYLVCGRLELYKKIIKEERRGKL